MTRQKIEDLLPSKENLMKTIMLTSSTAWDNELVENDIETWLQNFKGEVLPIKEEKLIALCLLSHFTYYNKNEVTQLCRVIYKDLIHLIISKNVDKDYVSTINNFLSKSNIVSPEQTSGSGGFIAYFFRHENHLPMTLFSSIDNIPDTIENLIIIDDVTLTAGKTGQLHGFLKKAKKKHPDKKYFLLTLISSEESIKALMGEFNIEVISAIKLDERDKCFSRSSDIFCTNPELTDCAKEIAINYGKKLHNNPLGFNNAQYTFGFFYNTPDNTLPIFWARINGWIPILRRYDKNYWDKNLKIHEKFI